MDTDWCDWLAEGLIGNGCQNLSIALLEGGNHVQERVRLAADRLHFPIRADLTFSEKIGYEVALTYSYGKKRSALLTHGFSLPVAMDPLMSSIYTGVAGGFVIITLDETPPPSYSSGCDPVSLAMFAKMPVLELSQFSLLPEGLKQAFALSEKYETPVMLHLDTKIPMGSYTFQGRAGKKRRTDFEKNPARWAATPRFRFLLHKKLNQRLKDIAESDLKNKIIQVEGKNKDLGIICNHANFSLIEPWAKRHNISLLSVQMPFPLPVSAISQFVEAHATTVVIEDRFPTIQFQLPQREEIRGRWTDSDLQKVVSWEKGTLIPVLDDLRAGKEPSIIVPSSVAETPQQPLSKLLDTLKSGHSSLLLVADKTPLTSKLPVDHYVSRGGAISVAAGFFHGGETESASILGITDSSAFLHYGMQATTNAIYNTANVRCILLVRPEHTRILQSFLDNLPQVETVPLNPVAKNAIKKLRKPVSRALTFYTVAMEEAV